MHSTIMQHGEDIHRSSTSEDAGKLLVPARGHSGDCFLQCARKCPACAERPTLQPFLHHQAVHSHTTITIDHADYAHVPAYFLTICIFSFLFASTASWTD